MRRIQNLNFDNFQVESVINYAHLQYHICLRFIFGSKFIKKREWVKNHKDHKEIWY